MEYMPSCVVSIGNGLCYGLARPPVKEACAEFLATFVLVVLGDGVMASCVLGRLDLDSVLAESLGWGFAVMIAVAIAGGVSGGHVNPAVTVALASGKKCAWKHVMPYMTAQYVGSFFAAAIVYATYIDAIHAYDGGVRQVPPSLNATAQIFATYPQDFASVYTCFLDQVLGSALFLVLICAVTDLKNLRVPPHAQPMMIGLGLGAIILAFGYNCGAPLNPARDFAPRLFTAVSGWGVSVFRYRNYEWFWVPIVAPHVGGIVGVWLYKALIEQPFKNYSRLLEMESPEIVESPPAFLNPPKSPLVRSVSDNVSHKRIPEQSAEQNRQTTLSVVEEQSLKEEKALLDPATLV